MAAKPSPSSSEGLKKLEEQLTCPICLDHFTNPKILPCFHSFCRYCLEGVPTDITEGNYYISCPTCRLACPVPDKGLATLPASFIINNFIEVYSLMKKVSGDTHASCDNCDKTDADCYCKQCTQFFCSQCLHIHDNWKPNANHQTISLEEVASMAHQLPTTRQEVTEYCTDHNKPLEIFCETCQELICHNCTVKKHRDHDYDIASDVYIKNRDVIVQSSLQPLNQEAEQLSLAIASLAIIRRSEVTQQGEAMNDEIEAIIIQIKSRLDETGRKLKEDVKSFMEHKVSVLERQIKEADAALGQVQECRDHVEQCVKVGTPHQVLTTKTQIGSHAETVLEQVKDKVFQPLVEADIRIVKSTNCGEVTCASDSSKAAAAGGPHKLHAVHVTLHVANGPISVPPVNPIVQLKGPTGVAVTDDGLVVISDDEKDCISIVDMEGSLIRSFGSYGDNEGELDDPQGVAITSKGTILVVDSSNYRIQEFTMEGECISCVGAKGEGPLEFLYPYGITVSKATGQVLIADYGNHQVQVLSSDLTFSHMFGSMLEDDSSDDDFKKLAEWRS